MLEPILAQIQNQLYQTVLDSLRQLLRSSLGQGQSGPALQAHVSPFDDMLITAAQRHGLDPALLRAIAQAESNFSPEAVSSAGAKGIMQLMDGTARQVGVTNSFDPAQNIEGGARLLRQLLDRCQGDEALAVAAYNAGLGAVQRWNGLPPYQETQVYVPRVLNLRDQYRQWTA